MASNFKGVDMSTSTDHQYTSIGIGHFKTLDEKTNLVVIDINGETVGYDTDKARFIANQIIATADYIDSLKND